MIIVYGTRLYGKVDKCGETHLATKFFHISWLPLIPLGTHLVLERQGGGSYRFLPQPLSGKSIAAALFRTWGLVGALGVAAGSLSAFGVAMDSYREGEGPGGLFVWPLIVLAAIAFVVFAFRFGRLAPVRAAQQSVYAGFVGYPVDVARFGERRGEVRHVVTEELAKRAQGLGLLGYRNDAAAANYGVLALDPMVTDGPFLDAALTLARLDWADAPRAERSEKAAVHQRIWKKIERRVQPAA